MAKDASDPQQKIEQQIKNAGLPTHGVAPFRPAFDKNKKGELIVKKARVEHGPRIGKYGYVDTQGRIWIKDRAHGKYPDHWDVQENGGKLGRTRVDSDGNILP
ncbi:MAG TPA: hypothetical protein VNH11_21665 [Pirellulales bacterium]|nr:hypothetical protein [Pirellulales bacterium]